MKTRLRITILHELPGRLRVRLSRPLADAEAFGRALRAHEGVGPARYARATRSVLVTYAAGHIRREELLVRMALAFSLEHDCAPVRIQKRTPDGLSAGEAVSGAALLVTGLARAAGLAPGRLRGMEHFAGLLTGGAVLMHGAREMRTIGIFHPEVFSLVYLAAGMLRGRAWQTALLTWFAAFGRHLAEVAEPAVEVQPSPSQQAEEVAVAEVAASPAQAFLHVVPAWIRAFQHAGRPGGDLLENLREISHHHDQVLDALGPWKSGIPVRFSRSSTAGREHR